MPRARLSSTLLVLNAATATLATCLLAMGGQQPWLGMLMLAVAVSTLLVVDLKSWLTLPRAVVNLGGLIAAALAVHDATRFTQEIRLLALANFMVYLQIVLLWLPKTVRVLRMILVLGLLQVAVGAALNLSLASGGVLVLYLASAVATVALVELHRASEQLASDAARWQPPRSKVRGMHFDGAFPAPAICVAPHAGDDPAAVHLAALAWPLGRVLLGALLICAALFLVIPRAAEVVDDEFGAGGASVVGPASVVTLGEEGTIVESNEETMEVQFFDHETNRVYRISDEPYFRGVVLTRYDRKRWLPPAFDRPEVLEPLEAASAPYLPELVRQEIRIGPQRTNTLYNVFPIINTREDGPLLFDARRQQIKRPNALRNQSFSYSLLTTGFYRGRQIPLTPAVGDLELGSLLQRSGDEALVTLRELAEEVVANIDANDHFSRARALESYLRHSGRFSYSLDISSGDPELDPVEDFVRNSRQGHCEYFASALTLMLRQIGIPARMVIGFKGGEWNLFGRFYRVRHSHAHAWVEAYLDPTNLPPDLPPPDPQWVGGGWLRLDPTPADAGGVALADAGALSQLMLQGIDFLRFQWTTYVLGMDAQRQWEVIYQPLLLMGQAALDLDAWRDLADWALRPVAGDSSGWFAGDWFNWRAGLLALPAALAVWGAWRFVRRVWRVILARTPLGQVVKARRFGFDVAFYRRLEDALASIGPARPPSQTQREFARAATARLRAAPLTRGVAEVPLHVVDAYYEVRFGGKALDKSQTESVEHALARLEAAVADALAAGPR